MSNWAWQDVRLMAKEHGGVVAWTDIKSWIDEQEMPKLQALFEEWHAKGAAYATKLAVGTMRKWEGKVTLNGLFDPAGGGPQAFFYDDGNHLGLTFSIAESFDAGANWFIFRVLMIDYDRKPAKPNYTRFAITMEPFGAPIHTASTPSGTTDPVYS